MFRHLFPGYYDKKKCILYQYPQDAAAVSVYYSYVVQCHVVIYHFRGRKPSQISRFYSHPWKFSPQNFRHAIPIYASLPTDPQSFLPRKFPAIHAVDHCVYLISDTAFMFIIGGLILVKIFQNRHPDIHANAFIAFFSFAVIIFFTLFGIVSLYLLMFLFKVCRIPIP